MKNIIIIASIVLLYGCSSKYPYKGTIEDAANNIGAGMESMKVDVLLPNRIDDAQLGDNPEKFYTVSNHLKDELTGLPSPHPYTFWNRRKENGVYKWDIKQDTSGIYVDIGTLEIYKKNGYLFINSPHDKIEKYIVEKILTNP